MDANKFNDPGQQGNVFGKMIMNPAEAEHNGRTPVNPEAESKAAMKSVRQEASFKTINVQPSQA